jgi:glycosyltransferase involved in cell wall biosynthesis
LNLAKPGDFWIMKPPTLSNYYKALAFIPYPIDGPSSRYRVHQYIDFFKRNQILCITQSIMNRSVYLHRMRGNNLRFKDYADLCISMLYRLILIFFSKPDIIIVHREIFPFSRSFIHLFFTKIVKIPFIYDFDDAIFTEFDIDNLLRHAKAITPGNHFLSDYAKSVNSKTVIQVIPTVVDTQYYKQRIKKSDSDNVIIGWIGTKSTYERYLSPKIAFLVKLAKQNSAQIHVIGPAPIRKHVVENGAVFLEWSLETECDHMAGFDIGVMPLFDDEFTRGKCAFKLVEYGAYSIPSVASAVGANLDVVVHNETGFLVNSDVEWESALVKLISNPLLRYQMGLKARERIVSRYSLESQVPVWVSLIERVIQEDRQQKLAKKLSKRGRHSE